MDLIGCINFAKDFVVSGTASPNLFGICEALYEPDLVKAIHKTYCQRRLRLGTGGSV